MCMQYVCVVNVARFNWLSNPQHSGTEKFQVSNLLASLLFPHLCAQCALMLTLGLPFERKIEISSYYEIKMRRSNEI